MAKFVYAKLLHFLGYRFCVDHVVSCYHTATLSAKRLVSELVVSEMLKC